MNQDVKNISSNSPIDEYLSKSIDTHKFIIVKNFAKKTYKQINSDYKNCEIFFFHEFREDIPSKLYIQKNESSTSDLWLTKACLNLKQYNLNFHSRLRNFN